MEPFSVLALGASIPALLGSVWSLRRRARPPVQKSPVGQDTGAQADLDIPNISEIKEVANMRTTVMETSGNQPGAKANRSRTQKAEDMSPKPFLVLSNRVGEHFQIPDGVTVIGRDEECDLVLHGDSVSRKHAKVISKPGGVMMYNTGSTNGVFVNGQLVTSKKLRSGDNVRLGDVEMVFADPKLDEEDEQPAVEPPAGRTMPEPAAPPFGRTMVKEEVIPAVAWLIVQPAGGAERSFGIGEGSYVIGRDAQCDVVVDDPYVSGVNSRLVVEGNVARLLDLGSANGTKVSGRRVDFADITSGNLIEVGNSRLTFVQSNAGAGERTFSGDQFPIGS